MPMLYESAIGYVIARSCHIMRREFKTTLDSAGRDLTPEEWGLLNRLWEHDGRRQAELAEATFRDRTTVTRLLDGMVKKGLVRRETDPSDRRAVQAWLTPEGRALRRELIPFVEELLRRGMRGIRKKDLKTTIDTLRRMQGNLIDSDDVD